MTHPPTKMPQHPYGTLPGEKVAYRHMIELRNQGRTVRQIAESMTRLGHPTRNGRPWAFASVAKILARHAQATDPDLQPTPEPSPTTPDEPEFA